MDVHSCIVRKPDDKAAFGWSHCSRRAHLVPEYGAGIAICLACEEDPRLVVRVIRGTTILELAHEPAPLS